MNRFLRAIFGGLTIILGLFITLPTFSPTLQTDQSSPGGGWVSSLIRPVSGAPKKSTPKVKQGWLYINKYTISPQLAERGGFAVAPFYIFDSTGVIKQSTEKNNTHSPGKLIPVDPGEYYVAAGKLNQGATRAKYTVEPGKVTVVHTGFVMVRTWKQDELPITGCSEWDGTMHVMAKLNDRWLPVMSNPPAECQTRHWGAIQLPVGNYRVLWNDMNVDIEIKKDQAYRLPLGVAGPLPDKGAKLASKSDAIHGAVGQKTVDLCVDGPTQVLAGEYWLLTTRYMEVFPYEQKEWSEMTVEPFDEHGYVMQIRPDRLKRTLLSGPQALPVPAPGEVNMSPPRRATGTLDGKSGLTGAGAGGAAKDGDGPVNLLGGQGIKWDAPL